MKSSILWLAATLAASAIAVGGSTDPANGTQVQVDFPVSLEMRNIGSRRDGAGMCTQTAIEMSGGWQNVPGIVGFRNWCALQPGGGYPEKIERQLTEYYRQRNMPVPPHVQYEGSDANVLRRLLASGRIACVTYGGQDGVYYRGRIAHMVDLVHFESGRTAILDSNYAGSGRRLWMDQDDFVRRWQMGGGGWVFAWASPGPPPIPHN